MTASFSISQKYEPALLLGVQEYFDTKAPVRLRRGAPDFYYLETYSRTSLLRVAKHVECYPLLGEKRVSFAPFASFLTSPSV